MECLRYARLSARLWGRQWSQDIVPDLRVGAKVLEAQ